MHLKHKIQDVAVEDDEDCDALWSMFDVNDLDDAAPLAQLDVASPVPGSKCTASGLLSSIAQNYNNVQISVSTLFFVQYLCHLMDFWRIETIIHYIAAMRW